MKIDVEVKSSQKTVRVSSHSHIKGLGLNDQGIAEISSHGFIGQVEAREVSSQQGRG